MPGLDGLRAVAVIGVLLYHAEVRWMPGGFLGVEVFFVISGYLITSLLLAEWSARAEEDEGRRSTLDLPRFWIRRARRLLPALYALLAATAALVAVRMPQDLADLRGDLAAALAYVTNWYLIFQHESYFQVMGRPSLLKHLWSLAVEEQFYILWPGLLLLAMRYLRRRGALVAVCCGVLASAALMAILYVPGADPTRVYYGTDTRAAGLLAGAALAFVWDPWRLAPQVSTQRRRLLDAASVAFLAVLVAWMALADEADPWLYRGGFLLLDLTTVALIAAVVHPAGRVRRLLGTAPLHWIGLRSYGIYLWHWPVFMATRPWIDVMLDGPALLGYRLALTFVLADVSYRWVEEPLRRGDPIRSLRALHLPQWAVTDAGRLLRRAGPGTARAAALMLLALPVLGLTPIAIHSHRAEAGVAAESAASVASAAAPAHRSATAAGSASSPADPTAAAKLERGTPAAGPGTRGPLASATRPGGPRATQVARAGSPRALPTQYARPTPVPAVRSMPQPTLPPFLPAARLLEPWDRVITNGRRLVAEGTAVAGARQRWLDPVAGTPIAEVPFTSTIRVTFIGDSVMLGAAADLQRVFGPAAVVDASISRQFYAGVETVRTYRQMGWLGDAVVIHLGNNGNLNAEQFDEMMALLSDVPCVLFLTVKVPRRWESSVNEAVSAGVSRWSHAALLDWRAASYHQPEMFLDDGIHLLPPGRNYYAYLILDAVRQCLGR